MSPFIEGNYSPLFEFPGKSFLQTTKTRKTPTPPSIETTESLSITFFFTISLESSFGNDKTIFSKPSSTQRVVLADYVLADMLHIFKIHKIHRFEKNIIIWFSARALIPCFSTINAKYWNVFSFGRLVTSSSKMSSFLLHQN